jgi:hypothetical protein
VDSPADFLAAMAVPLLRGNGPPGITGAQRRSECDSPSVGKVSDREP